MRRSAYIPLRVLIHNLNDTVQTLPLTTLSNKQNLRLYLLKIKCIYN